MLENSFNIRSNSEKLILYSSTEDWNNYAKAIGAIIKDLIYFKFDIDSPLNLFKNDTQSPYWEDPDTGNLYLKNNSSAQLAVPLKSYPKNVTIEDKHHYGMPWTHPLVLQTEDTTLN